MDLCLANSILVAWVGACKTKIFTMNTKLEVQRKFISKPWNNFVATRCFAGHVNHLTNQPLVTFSWKIDHHNKGNLKQRYNGSGAFRSRPNYRIF